MLQIRNILLSSKAAIDLASIMVGIIVIGLIGGVIAATVFAVIPWAQDNAAKQQLESIHTAQNAAYGFSADPNYELMEGWSRNSFTDSQRLNEANLLSLSPNGAYCTVQFEEGKNYIGWVKSASGKIFYATNNNKTAKTHSSLAVLPCVTGAENSVPVDENGNDIPVGGYNPETIEPGSTEPSNPEQPAIPGEEEPTPPTLPDADAGDIQFTVNCPTSQTRLNIPLASTIGTVVVKDEQQQVISSNYNDRSNGMYNMKNLIAVPDTLPVSVTNISYAFQGASSFNQDISSWNTSNITTMRATFASASSFNQDISNWDTSNVTNMSRMFYANTGFNQNISNWNVAKTTDWLDFATRAVLQSANKPSKFR